jgi:hypothetical protein
MLNTINFLVLLSIFFSLHNIISWANKTRYLDSLHSNGLLSLKKYLKKYMCWYWPNNASNQFEMKFENETKWEENDLKVNKKYIINKYYRV